MSETESFHGSSATKVFKHRIRDTWTGARLRVHMTIEDGGATMRLIDESGKTRLEKSFAAGDQSIDETFAGNGLWRVELRLKNATGRYSIKLVAV